MNNKELYQSDVKFIDKIDKMLARRLDHTAYVFAFAACLLAHVLYIILFGLAEVQFMVIFNLFSVSFYVLLLFLVNVVKEKLNLVYAAIAEIVLHASVATVCVGIEPRFCMFLLMIIPLIFLMPNKNRFAPFVVLFISVPLYGVLNYYFDDRSHVLFEITPIFNTVFFITNFLIGSMVLIFISIIFSLMNHYIESKLRVQTEQLVEMASTDPLTKLYNRREMQSRLNAVSSVTDSGSQEYVVGLGDIDDFKQVNDTYGHDSGDMVLAKVASIISGGLPEGSSACRWGGEEFLFLIPGCDITKGKEYADKIISDIRAHKFESGGKEFSVTMTIGICSGTSKDDIYDIINISDSRLYKGKHNGKAHTEFES